MMSVVTTVTGITLDVPSEREIDEFIRQMALCGELRRGLRVALNGFIANRATAALEALRRADEQQQQPSRP